MATPYMLKRTNEPAGTPFQFGFFVDLSCFWGKRVAGHHVVPPALGNKLQKALQRTPPSSMCCGSLDSCIYKCAYMHAYVNA
eukprot:1150049-Pelagomonas_calceolata.AAC.15